jgi:hypothetical protein
MRLASLIAAAARPHQRLDFAYYFEEKASRIGSAVARSFSRELPDKIFTSRGLPGPI